MGSIGIADHDVIAARCDDGEQRPQLGVQGIFVLKGPAQSCTSCPFAKAKRQVFQQQDPRGQLGRDDPEGVQWGYGGYDYRQANLASNIVVLH